MNRWRAERQFGRGVGGILVVIGVWLTWRGSNPLVTRTLLTVGGVLRCADADWHRAACDRFGSVGETARVGWQLLGTVRGALARPEASREDVLNGATMAKLQVLSEFWEFLYRPRVLGQWLDGIRF